MSVSRRVVAAVLFAMVFCPRQSLAADSIEYLINFSDAANHSIQIKMTINDLRDAETTLMMPTWTPGSYLIREYARNINRIEAVGGDGSRLNLTKLNRNRWQLSGPTGGKAIVTYRLYCHEMSVRTNWVDSDMAILNGAATFLTVPGRRNQTHSVTLNLPERWARGVCSLEEITKGRSWKAITYEELVDSPIIAGNPVIKEFQAADRPHQLVSMGDTTLWQLDKAADDVQKVVAEHQRMFTNAPYDDYKFLNMITEGRGGLEHNNCTLLMTSRWNFRDSEKYEDWLSLVSHEFFHTWNVRRLRPSGIWEYDLENENYTPSLWIAEGVTSYYEDIALVRAGIINEKAYLKRLSKGIKSLQTANGRKVQSLTDSSHDTWIKFYRPDENSKNSRVSYYTKGAVVAFLLDAKIRLTTDNSKSLDDVMRTMYGRFAGKQGYDERDFRDTASEIAGVDLTKWFSVNVDGTTELHYDEALAFFGLKFADKDSDDDESPDPSEKTTGKDQKQKSETDAAKPDVGITLLSTNDNPTISAIRSDSAAFLAGLNVQDEIIAVNGYRVTKGNWEDRLTSFARGEGKDVELTVSRRGQLRTVVMALAKASQATWKLEKVAKPSEEQKKRISMWLTVVTDAD